MKRVGNLMPRICDYDNINEAFLRAVKGKRGKREVVVYSATGIGSVESDKNEKHDIYSLNGQRVTTMRKGGIYIVNGRKVLAK